MKFIDFIKLDNLGFMSLEHFRLMYEELAEEVLTGDMEESYNGFSI